MLSAGNMVQIALGNEVAWNEGANGHVRFAGMGGTDKSDFFRKGFIFSNRAIESYADCKLEGAQRRRSRCRSRPPFSSSTTLLQIGDDNAKRWLGSLNYMR